MAAKFILQYFIHEKRETKQKINFLLERTKQHFNWDKKYIFCSENYVLKSNDNNTLTQSLISNYSFVKGRIIRDLLENTLQTSRQLQTN